MLRSKRLCNPNKLKLVQILRAVFSVCSESLTWWSEITGLKYGVNVLMYIFLDSFFTYVPTTILSVVGHKFKMNFVH